MIFHDIKSNFPANELHVNILFTFHINLKNTGEFYANWAPREGAIAQQTLEDFIKSAQIFNKILEFFIKILLIFQGTGDRFSNHSSKLFGL